MSTTAMRIAYFEAILATSKSEDRRIRAARQLVILREEAAQLERVQVVSPPSPPVCRDDPDYDIIWSGGEGLTSMGERRKA